MIYISDNVIAVENITPTRLSNLLLPTTHLPNVVYQLAMLTLEVAESMHIKW